LAGISSDDLKQDLKKGNFKPVYLLLGPEFYLRDRAARMLKKILLEAEAMGFDYSEFHAKQTPMAQIIESVSTFPMLSKVRLVIVTELDSAPAAQHEALLAYLERPARRGVLVLIADDLDKRTILARRLLERACVVEFPLLKDYGLKSWANEYIRRSGCVISPGALDRLISLSGSELMPLVNEIEKLVLYVGESRSIPDEVVEKLVVSSHQNRLYELTGAIGRKDRKEALRLLSNILESGEPPLVILSALARHFRQVLIAREALDAGQDARTAAAAAQADPRWADTLARTARSVEPENARKMCLRSAEADRRIKSTGLDEKLILESLIHSI
jgi:DNA polymerase III subunit delta